MYQRIAAHSPQSHISHIDVSEFVCDKLFGFPAASLQIDSHYFIPGFEVRIQCIDGLIAYFIVLNEVVFCPEQIKCFQYPDVEAGIDTVPLRMERQFAAQHQPAGNEGYRRVFYLEFDLLFSRHQGDGLKGGVAQPFHVL